MESDTEMTSNEVGDCFSVAARIVVEAQDESLTLCHGTVWHEAVGYHAHAWVELTRMIKFHDLDGGTLDRELTTCIDKSNGNDLEVPIGLYYKLGRIEENEVQRYDFRTAAALMVVTEHFGPWES